MSDHTHLVRKWVKPEDLNQHGALFGGRLLQWVDEEAAIVAITHDDRYFYLADRIIKLESGQVV